MVGTAAAALAATSVVLSEDRWVAVAASNSGSAITNDTGRLPCGTTRNDGRKRHRILLLPTMNFSYAKPLPVGKWFDGFCRSMCR